MTDDTLKQNGCHKELFQQLKKSLSLKREEECFGAYLKPSMWWLIEKPHPKQDDLAKLAECSCPYFKRGILHRGAGCLSGLLDAAKRAYSTKGIVKYECVHGLHGFLYPIIQNNKVCGYIGTCYKQHDVSPELLGIFSAFMDTIVKENQKELELSKLYETVRPRAIALSTVHTVYRLISSTLDLNELLPRIARLSLQIIRANRCSIKLVDSTKKLLLPKTTVDLRSKTTTLKKVPVGKFAPGQAVKHGRPIRGKAFLAVPLIDEDVIGVITLYDKVDKKQFSQFDQEIMTTLAEQAVIAIKNAQLYKEQEKLTTGAIKSLAALLSARGPGTYTPNASFLRITMAMGQGLHMSAMELKSLEYAVLLHDTGQIVIPEEVLTKPTKLTGKEYEMVKEHPLRGVEIIKHISPLKSVIPIILYHHENWDGTGYPKGLKKNQIPLAARVMAIVGAFEAMIVQKPYRVAKTIDEAIDEIKKNAGRQFDPKVVEVFLNAVNRKDIRAMLERELYELR